MSELQRPVSRDLFQIAIFCALKIEFDTVEALFDHFWEDEEVAYTKAPGDFNAYTLGRIGQHDVVLVLMPRMGKASSASVTANCKSSFPHIKLALVVGICGGVPKTPDGNEIILGDVIVSAGIVQYDFARQFPHGAIRKDTLEDALLQPTEIKTFLDKIAGLRTRTLLKDTASRFLGIILAREGFEKSGYPGTAKDQLYKSNYRHKHQNSTACDICVECLNQEDLVCEASTNLSCATLGCSDQLVARDRLSKQPEIFGDRNNFAVHFGSIASGDLVMKSAQFRDVLAAKEQILGFEMEGVGSSLSFPTIVVKGVCDYADSHKNKEWQLYASATAAATAKALLKEWRATDTSSLSQQETSMVLHRGKTLVSNNNKLIPREMWSVNFPGTTSLPELLERLSDYDQEKVHGRLKSKRLPETCNWLFSHSSFDKWFNSSTTASLWLSGTVGSGKTILCTALVDHLKQHSKCLGDVVVHFYCNPSDLRSVRPVYLFESLTKQLLEHLIEIRKTPQDIIHKIETLYSPTGPEPDLDDVFKILAATLSLVPNAWLIIDGFDEIELSQVSLALSYLRKLFNDASSQKLWIASRKEIALNTTISLMHKIEILQFDTDNDIRRYISAEILRKTEHERVLTENSNVIEQIKKFLSQKAHGMFLWVRLQIEALWLDCVSDAEILKSLKDLPPDLPMTYKRCLERIPPSAVDLSRRVFRWVVCAVRPLDIRELQEAVAFTLEDREWDCTKVPNRSNLIRSCSNLIDFDERDLSVRLIHPSVKQYLCRPSSALPNIFLIDEKMDNLCGMECINYLSFSDFGLQLQHHLERRILGSVPSPSLVLQSLPQSNFTRKISKFAGLNSVTPTVPIVVNRRERPPLELSDYSQYAFLNYVIHNWATHTKNISKASPSWEQFQSLVLKPNGSFRFHPWNPENQSFGSHVHGVLAYATREGHLPLLQALLEQRLNYSLAELSDIPFVEDGLPALHAASRQGLTDVVTLLLKFCSVNARDVKSRTALHYAAEKNHLKVAQLLISQHKVVVDGISKSDETPIGLAAWYGHAQMVSLFLNASRSIPSERHLLANPLAAAVDQDNVDVLEMILRRRTNIPSWVVSTLVAQTSRPLSNVYNDTLFAITLLQPLVREIVRDDFVQAVQNRFTSMAELLIERSSLDINAKHKSSHLPLLHYVIESGQEAILALLLARSDLIINSQVNATSTSALMLSTQKGDVGMVRLLLQRQDIQANDENSYGCTALLIAADQGYEQIVKLLLQRADVDVNKKDGKGHTALSLAAKNGHQEVVRLLLARLDIDVNLSEPLKHTPLSFAVKNGHEEVVKLLLQRRDIDTERRYEHGRPVSSLMTVGAQVETVKTLPEGNDINDSSTDRGGYTALTIAVRCNRPGIFKLLIERDGFDVNARDNKGRSLIFHVKDSTHKEIKSSVLKHDGVNINLRDDNGITALMYAILKYQLDVLKILLSRKDVDVNVQDTSRRTALIYAVLKNAEDILALLLERKDIDINLQDETGQTALMGTTWRDKLDSTRLLLGRSDIDINLQDVKGQTTLMHAVRTQHNDIAMLLLRRSDVDVNLQDAAGQTILMYAVKPEQAHIMGSLLERSDVDVNLQDAAGQTILMHAVKAGQARILNFVLERFEVDVNLQDAAGQTALMHAVKAGQALIMESLLKRSDIDVNLQDAAGQTALDLKDAAGQTALIQAVRFCHTPTLRRLLGKEDVNVNVNVNEKDKEGRTAAHYAFAHGAMSLLLVRNDVDFSIQDDRGCTPLMVAVDLCKAWEVQMMLQSKQDVDLNKQDHIGWTALFYAIWRDNDTILSYLLARKDIDAEKRDNGLKTPLIVAARENRATMVSRLLARGDVDINKQDYKGRTALIHTVQRNSQETWSYLLRRSDLRAHQQDYQGRTALMHAVIGGRLRMLREMLQEMLPDHYIGVNLRDDQGKTAIDHAHESGDGEVLKILSEYIHE